MAKQKKKKTAAEIWNEAAASKKAIAQVLPIHVPSVCVNVRATDDHMTTTNGGEYFETCYEIRGEEKRAFAEQLRTLANAISLGLDPKADRFVAFIGIGRRR